MCLAYGLIIYGITPSIDEVQNLEKELLTHYNILYVSSFKKSQE